jgi:hypothetical protein
MPRDMKVKFDKNDWIYFDNNESGMPVGAKFF